MSKNLVGNIIVEKGLEGLNRFYGIYRALVRENRDPTNTNRLLLWIPEVMGGIVQWAYPRGQYGSIGYGVKWVTPKINEVVYVTFEYGDASKPLWEPHGWSKGESPSPINHPAVGGFITPRGNMFYYDERDNSLHINFKGTIYVQGGEDVVVVAKDIISISSENGVILNGGGNGGMVNAAELTQKLNQLVQELETQKQQLNLCISLLNTHTHNCTAPGTPSGPNLMQMQAITQKFSQFNSLDYEDEKALH